MRILILNHEFPPVGGGAATACRAIAMRMAGRGHRVRVLTGAFDGLPTHELNGFETYRIPAVRRSLYRSTPPEMLTFAVLGLGPALGHYQRFRPHVAIAFFGVPAGVIALAGRAVYRVPYIVSLRGGDVPGYAGIGPWAALGTPLLYPVWRNAHAIVANSAGLRDLALRMARRLGRDVLSIPNGVDIERFEISGRPSPDGALRLLFVGRLAPEKGLDVLLQALESLSEGQRSQLRLTVVGDGPLRARLEASTRRLLPGQVKHLGWRPRDELPAIYVGSQVLVLPSLMEGMPNVMLEAMAAGLPVIATRVGGCPELVSDGENGLLVEPGSPPALAAAISAVLARKDSLQEWGTASRRRVAAFSWDAVVDGYLALAETAAGRRRRSTPASLRAG